MTTNDNTTTGSDGVTINVDADNQPEGFRKALDRANDRVAELEGRLKAAAFNQLGIDPEKGVGKAIAALYDGEPDVEAIAKFAADEFEWQPTGEVRSEQETRVADAQSRMDEVRESSSPVTPPVEEDLDAQIAAAEAAGDFQTSLNLKMQKVRDAFS